jgi:putative ABC transport system permease protein
MVRRGLDIRENFLVAWSTLRANGVRSALTILGIVIGVTSVISVAAIIEGLNKFISDKVESFGPNTYFMARIPLGDPRAFFNQPEKIRIRKHFEWDYGEKMRTQSRYLKTVTVFGTRASFFGDANDIRYGSERVERVILRGTEPEYTDAIPLFSVEHGRFISKFDVDHARQVVVLGAAIAESLFGNLDPLGKTVRLNALPYEVIGVFAHDAGLFGGPGVDNFAIVPSSDFRKKNPQAKELILAFIGDKEAPPGAAREEAVEVMRRIRHVKPDAEDDFEVIASDFLSTLWNQLTGALVILTGVISSVGLLVGGVGVMNIMLISVTERTAEIGVRKAMGARKSDIRIQFLIEASVLTVIGGTIGILIGAVIAFGIRTLVPGIPATLSPLWVALGVAMSLGTGIFFGYYPANRAANLDPIECLRYE